MGHILEIGSIVYSRIFPNQTYFHFWITAVIYWLTAVVKLLDAFDVSGAEFIPLSHGFPLHRFQSCEILQGVAVVHDGVVVVGSFQGPAARLHLWHPAALSESGLHAAGHVVPVDLDPIVTVQPRVLVEEA